MSSSATSDATPINIQMLVCTVGEYGGCQQVTEDGNWEDVAKRMGLLKSSAEDLKRTYENHLKEQKDKDGDDSGVSDEEEYEVETIIGDKKRGKTTLYLVKWNGFGESENSWEPESNLANCPHKIKAYKEEKERKMKAQQAGTASKRAKVEEGTPWGFVEAVMDETAWFNTDEAEMVVGAARYSEDKIKIMVKWKGESDRYTWVDSIDCRKNIPELLIEFYESRLKFVENQG